jgi:putative flippase GtrA
MRQFYRYLLAGLICVGVEYGSFMAVHHGLGWGLVKANTLAYGLAFISNFLLNKFWVFTGTQQLQTQYQLMAFSVLALCNYALGTGLLLHLAQTWALPAWLAKGLSMAAIAIWNFLIYKKVIYR